MNLELASTYFLWHSRPLFSTSVRVKWGPKLNMKCVERHWTNGCHFFVPPMPPRSCAFSQLILPKCRRMVHCSHVMSKEPPISHRS